MKQRDLEALLADMTLKEKADQMLQVVGQDHRRRCKAGRKCAGKHGSG